MPLLFDAHLDLAWNALAFNRDLTESIEQINAAEHGMTDARDAVIGASFDNWMIVLDWKTGRTPRSEATFDRIADHVNHTCQLAGSHRHCAIGTDLDGGYGAEQSPHELKTIADVQKFALVLERRGYSAAAIDDIFHGNWLRFFSENMPTNSRASPSARN